MKHDAFAGGVSGPATTPLPELGRLQLGQERFQSPGSIELLAHDRRDLLQHAPQQRQVGIDAAAHPADIAGAQQQLVGRDLGFSGVIPQRHQHEAGDAHGMLNREEAGSYHRAPSIAGSRSATSPTEKA